jgi:hypothetical protein
MNNTLEFKSLLDGRLAVRRRDGLPVTAADIELARQVARRQTTTTVKTGTMQYRLLTASELITEAAERGLTLTLEGQNIRVHGHPADRDSAAVIEEIRSREAEVVHALGLLTAKCRIQAVEICSNILEAHIWLALDPRFDPGDGQRVYYPDEITFLATKAPQTLREIHNVKLAFGPGTRVRE